MPGLDSEALDLRVASESFAPVCKLARRDLQSLRLVTAHQGRQVPTVGGMPCLPIATRRRLAALVGRGLVREIGTGPKLRLSAVKVVAHGEVTSTSAQPFFLDVMRTMTPQNAPTPIEGPPLAVDLGTPLYDSPRGPKDDTALYTVAPRSYFINRGALGDLCCVETSVAQLRDVMPFDTVVVRLAIHTLTDRAVDFRTTYHRQKPDGTLTLVAAGKHKAVWARVRPGEAIVAEPWPADVRAALLASVETTTRANIQPAVR